MEIRIQKATELKAKPDSSTLGFGRKFTDHMFRMSYSREKGWYDARIVPYGNIELNPCSVVFHYGAEIFEGMKAYRTADGEIQLFRPMENIRRMNQSAERMALPQLDEQDALQAITELVKLEADWVPAEEGTSLYIRPFMFGNDEHLGVHSIDNAEFLIILSPVGSYYAEGVNPVKIMIETEDVRAVRGGTGYAKCGGNYAAATRAGERAEKKGYTQVLWLDGVERKYIEEVGAMNVMFKINGTIVTPKLTGSVLPGITRKSILELLRDKGYKVEERLISIDEVLTALKDGTMEEFWGCGTAAVVSPVGALYYEGTEYVINDSKIGPVTQMLYDTLTGIQWGKTADPYNWVYKI